MFARSNATIMMATSAQRSSHRFPIFTWHAPMREPIPCIAGDSVDCNLTGHMHTRGRKPFVITERNGTNERIRSVIVKLHAGFKTVPFRYGFQIRSCRYVMQMHKQI